MVLIIPLFFYCIPLSLKLLNFFISFDLLLFPIIKHIIGLGFFDNPKKNKNLIVNLFNSKFFNFFTSFNLFGQN
jgi:hypothetical protein